MTSYFDSCAAYGRSDVERDVTAVELLMRAPTGATAAELVRAAKIQGRTHRSELHDDEASTPTAAGAEHLQAPPSDDTPCIRDEPPSLAVPEAGGGGAFGAQMRTVRAHLDGPRHAATRRDVKRDANVAKRELASAVTAIARREEADARTAGLLCRLGEEKAAAAAAAVEAAAEEERLRAAKPRRRPPQTATRPGFVADGSGVATDAALDSPPSASSGQLDPFQRLRAEELRQRLVAEETEGGIVNMYNRVALRAAHPELEAAADALVFVPPPALPAARIQSIFSASASGPEAHDGSRATAASRSKDEAARVAFEEARQARIARERAERLPPLIDQSPSELHLREGRGAAAYADLVNTLSLRAGTVARGAAALRGQDVEDVMEQRRRLDHNRQQRITILEIDRSPGHGSPSVISGPADTVSSTGSTVTGLPPVGLPPVGVTSRPPHPIDVYHAMVRQDVERDFASRVDLSVSNVHARSKLRGTEDLLA